MITWRALTNLMSTVDWLCMKTLFIISCSLHIWSRFCINQVALRLCIKGTSKLLMMRLDVFIWLNLVINHACRLIWLVLLWMHVYDNLWNTTFFPYKQLKILSLQLDLVLLCRPPLPSLFKFGRFKSIVTLWSYPPLTVTFDPLIYGLFKLRFPCIYL